MSIASVLEQLRKEYIPDLQAEVAALAAAVDARNAVEVKRLAHRIAGSAGSYGFDEVTTAARVVEKALAANDEPALSAAATALTQTVAGIVP